MKLVNLTPHPLVIETAGGDRITAPPSGTVARVAETTQAAGTVEVVGHAVPLVRRTLGAVENLPAPAEDTLYVVSSLVADAIRDRTDLVAPADFVRDETGRIVAARALAFPR